MKKIYAILTITVLVTTITLGTQVWIVENLKPTHYRDGTAIPNITDNTAWTNTTRGITDLHQPFYIWVIVMRGGPAPLLLQEQAMHCLQKQNGIIHTSTDPASLEELDIMIREQDILSVL